MAFDPKSITKGKEKEARKIIIYGDAKVGKSTLASSGKNTFIIPTEDRVSHIDAAKAPIIKTYAELVEIFEWLLEGKHSFETIVLDTLDEFEPILHEGICLKHGWTSLHDDKNSATNYKQGIQIHAPNGWRKFLEYCDYVRLKKNLNIVFVAHAQIIKRNPPNTEPFDQLAMKIDKNSLTVLTGWADVIGCYARQILTKVDVKKPGKPGKIIASEKRILHLSGNSEAMVSCNSYGFEDCEIPLEECGNAMKWLLNG